MVPGDFPVKLGRWFFPRQVSAQVGWGCVMPSDHFPPYSLGESYQTLNENDQFRILTSMSKIIRNHFVNDSQSDIAKLSSNGLQNDLWLHFSCCPLNFNSVIFLEQRRVSKRV